MGAHQQPMLADADLSLRGIARLVVELIERLDLNDVTLVGNDSGGALVQLLVGDGSPRITSIVLVSCATRRTGSQARASSPWAPSLSSPAWSLHGKTGR